MKSSIFLLAVLCLINTVQAKPAGSFCEEKTAIIRLGTLDPNSELNLAALLIERKTITLVTLDKDNKTVAGLQGTWAFHKAGEKISMPYNKSSTINLRLMEDLSTGLKYKIYITWLKNNKSVGTTLNVNYILGKQLSDKETVFLAELTDAEKQRLNDVGKEPVLDSLNTHDNDKQGTYEFTSKELTVGCI